MSRRGFTAGERIGRWVGRKIGERQAQRLPVGAAEVIDAQPGPGFVAPNMDVDLTPEAEVAVQDARQELEMVGDELVHQVASKIYGKSPSQAQLQATARYLYPDTLTEDDGYGFTDLATDLPFWEVEARALDRVARWAEQPDVPTGMRGALTSLDLRLRAAGIRARGPFDEAVGDVPKRDVVLVVEADADEVRFEDAGQAAMLTVSQADESMTFVRIHSWVDDGDPLAHTLIQDLKHSRLRVTVERIS